MQTQSRLFAKVKIAINLATETSNIVINLKPENLIINVEAKKIKSKIKIIKVHKLPLLQYLFVLSRLFIYFSTRNDHNHDALIHLKLN